MKHKNQPQRQKLRGLNGNQVVKENFIFSITILTTMRNFFKNINKFGLVAILLAGTTAFAFKAPVPKSKFVNVTWRRIGTTSDPNQNVWMSGAGTGTCNLADNFCELSFASGYNPNSHDYDTNVANGTDIGAGNGYKTN